MAKGQAKGSNFEREMCKQFSLWLTKGEREDILARNRVRKTAFTPDKLFQLGDLAAAHTLAIPFIETFNVELKSGYSRKTKSGKKAKLIPWDVLDLIDGEGTTLLDFWEQCLRDARLSKRIPLLIFKRDYHKPVLVIDQEIFIIRISVPYLVVKMDQEKVLFLFSLDRFLERFSPTVMLEYAQRIINYLPKEEPKKSRLIA